MSRPAAHRTGRRRAHGDGKDNLLLQILIALLIFGGTSSPTAFAQATADTDSRPDKSIPLILSRDADPYRDFEATFRSTLAEADPAIRVETTVLDQEDTDTDGPGVRVAVGLEALKKTLAAGDGPVIAALVPSRAMTDVLSDYPERVVSGLYVDQPLARHLALIRAVLPGSRTVGRLNTETSEARSPPGTSDLEPPFDTESRRASDRGELIQAVRSLADSSDALLITPSSLISDPRNLRALLLHSFRAGLPTFAYSPGLVEAGSVAAVFSHPEDVGRETAGMLTELLDRDTGDWPPPRHPASFHVSVNRQVADALRLTLPSVAAIEDFIRRNEP